MKSTVHHSSRTLLLIAAVTITWLAGRTTSASAEGARGRSLAPASGSGSGPQGGVAATVGAPRRALTQEERVAARRAIEEIYWQHRIWPSSNPGAKPSLEEVLPEAMLRRKVDDDLRQASALDVLWRRPITAAQLQTEIDRMAKSTRRPDVLAELYASLGDDPLLIAETLARPNLVSRSIQRWYARDPRFHGDLRIRIERAVAEAHVIEDLAGSGGEIREMEMIRSEGEGESVEDEQLSIDGSIETGAAAVRRVNADEWDRLQSMLGLTDRSGTDAFRPAAPAIVPSAQTVGASGPAIVAAPARTFRGRAVLQLGTIQETDEAFTVTAVLDASTDALSAVVVSWPKTPFDAWWRQTRESFPPEIDLPALQYAFTRPASGTCVNDTWTPDAPDPRSGHTAVWTGTEMIVWGGAGRNSGGRYDPSTDTWTLTSVGANVPSARYGHTAVWTGSEMIVWGGTTNGALYLNTGGHYRPSTDSWTATSTGANVPAGRYGHSAVWTGTEMIVWGGQVAGGSNVRTGGRYNPSGGGTWTATSVGSGVPSVRSGHKAVWTGTEMIVWGGANGATQLATGARYRPSNDTWTATSSMNAPSARSSHKAIWTGSVMIVWGGGGDNTGGRYDPVANSWSPTSTGPGTPSSRSGHTAVWTGQRMIVWGGSGGSLLDDGGEYDPVSDSWTAIASGSVPPRSGHTAVWTGSEMIVWGGGDNGGARYSPASQTWKLTPATDPIGREFHTAVWTGSEMIVWGGISDLGTNIPFQTGGRYDPSTDTWSPTSISMDTPAARGEHSAVWTGTEMIVWGGHSSLIADSSTDTGGRYDPMTDAWSPTSTTGAPSARYLHAAVWTGTEMIVWGGFDNTGGRYDPADDSWTPTTTVGAPDGRSMHTMVWTGIRAIVWGGRGINFIGFNTGGLYDPVADSWTPTGTGTGVPVGRELPAAVWTGSEMIVWGGRVFNPGSGTYTRYDTGGRYDPATDLWTPTSGTGAPSGRSGHKAVWTGNEMIVWGGFGFDPEIGQNTDLNSGGRYNPAADFWQPTNRVGAPPGRGNHTTVATGTEMLVWGGVPSYPVVRDGNYCYACTASTWYRDADGDGYGNPSSSASSCVQPPGWAAAGGDCNDASSAIHPGAIELCNAVDDDCDGTTDDALPPASPPVVQVARPDADTIRIDWAVVPTASAYDLVRGDLALLHTSGGNFTAATGACLGSDLAATTFDDETALPGGQAYWYLARAVNCGGAASYDEGVPSQIGSRDAEIQASGPACP